VRRPLAIPALAAVLIAGCGDEEEASRTVTVKGGGPVEVTGREYSFDPDTVVYDAAGPRAEVRISLDNRGSLAHNLRVFDGDNELGGTPTFQGGREESGAVGLAPGEYRMVCTVGNHDELGMHGRLEIR
jgi:plastocyanin